MTLPNVDMNLLDQPTLEKVQAKELDHPPRILLLYGSNRERSYSRLAVMEAGRILEQFEPYRVCRRVNILRDYPDDKIKIYP